MTDCWYKHPEDFCTLKKGDCPFQGELMRCIVTQENLIEYCPDCDKPIDPCECELYWYGIEELLEDEE
ncbi:hypothetical protein ES702_01809 [subsurface metagenome]